MDSCMRGDVDDARQTLKYLLHEDLDAWVELNVLLEGFSGCERHRVMAENLLQWSARRVYGLSMQWQAAMEGMMSYRNLYHSRYPSK